jgi:hypothetical protein
VDVALGGCFVGLEKLLGRSKCGRFVKVPDIFRTADYIRYYSMYRLQKKILPTGGLEPPIFGLGDRRLIHWATRAFVTPSLYSNIDNYLGQIWVDFIVSFFPPHIEVLVFLCRDPVFTPCTIENPF